MNDKAYIKLLTNAMYDIQKVRIAVDNRIQMFNKSIDDDSKFIADSLNDIISKKLNDTEDAIAKDLATYVQNIPIMKWLNEVSGIGPRLGGSLIGVIGELPDTVSQLWSYCGMSTIPICEKCNKIAYKGEERIRFCRTQAKRRWEANLKQKTNDNTNEEDFQDTAYKATESKLCQCDGAVTYVAPKRMYFAGLLLTYNPFLKSTCYKISGQFVKQGKFYRTIYEQAKEKYSKDSNLTKIHIENRARRYTVKLFLSHLHEMWSKAEGKPIKEFYYKEFGDFSGHTYIEPPYHDIYG